MNERTNRIARRLVAAGDLDKTALEFHQLCRKATDRLRWPASPIALVSFSYSLFYGLRHHFSFPSISSDRALEVRASLNEYNRIMDKAAVEYNKLVKEMTRLGLPNKGDSSF